MSRVRPPRAAAGVVTGVVAAGVVIAAGACTEITPRNERFRLPAEYNFAFYDTHTDAARSFYAAHYAHFGVYETGLVEGEDDREAFRALESEIRRLIVEPPRFEPSPEVVAPQWVKIAFPTARAMDWTHMLHSQLYDILTDPEVENRRAAGERAISYYLANGGSAFSTRGYGHRWMTGGGSWAGVFAEKYPDLNGILWAYHWHHAAVYEALMEEDPDARARELDRVIRVFVDSVLVDPPEEMPLTAEVAPRFSRMFPAAAHVFDNLHMMHDVVNDIMVDPRIPREEKAAEIERMRRSMSYPVQDFVVAPGMPMDGGAHGPPGADGPGAGMPHAMSEGAFRVPTRLPDGRWLPQGHPEARRATMDELMAPLPPPDDPRPAEAPTAPGHHHERGGAR